MVRVWAKYPSELKLRVYDRGQIDALTKGKVRVRVRVRVGLGLESSFGIGLKVRIRVRVRVQVWAKCLSELK
jgi:hypothetical protein